MSDQSQSAQLCYSVKEAGRQLGDYSTRSVYNLIAAGKLKAIRIGGHTVITHAALEALIAAAAAEAEQ